MKPPSAAAMAGRSSSAKSRVPWAVSSSSHAATAPGMVTAWGEVLSRLVTPAAWSASGVAPAGARPEPFSAKTRPVPAGA